MQENECIVNNELVRSLIESQCPHWTDLPIKAISSCGTDNALFRLGDKYVVRLRRTGKTTTSIHKEYEWTPKIAQLLRIPISEPIFKGEPHQSYPWSWLVHKWIEGDIPTFEKDNAYEQLAKDLAYFLNELHQIKLSNGPTSIRGMSLKERDFDTKKAIHKLSDEIDTKRITELWEKLSNISPYTYEPAWIHGDLLPVNILIKNNRLRAVIDFSDLGLGDPACDLVIAWSLFDPKSRLIFRKNLKHIDDTVWQRGRGWALSIALIVLPRYKDTNPTIASVARQMIKNVA